VGKSNNVELSIVLPCRNEEKAIGFCIKQIQEVIDKNKLNAEIIVSDSSSDKSPEITKRLNAKLVKHNKKGYGIAYLEGFKEAKGKYIIIGDADGTYDFRNIPLILHYLKNKNYDMVIGNRFKGKMHKKAMPFLHRYVGNPILSSLIKLFFNTKIGDSHCGLRGFTRKALSLMDLRTTGMEFASEMVMKAVKNDLRIKEIPINYHKRIGKSKLNTFSDGWRHLRFMLMYAPNYLFIVPGITLLILGLVIGLQFYFGTFEIFKIRFYDYPMLIGCFCIILGYQIINLGLFCKTYAKSIGFEKRDRMVEFISKIINFESGLLFGFILVLISLLWGALNVVNWFTQGFKNISNIKDYFIILTLFVLGIQTIFSAFLISIMLVEKR